MVIRYQDSFVVAMEERLIKLERYYMKEYSVRISALWS